MYTEQELSDMILDLRAKILDMKNKIEGMDETLDELIGIKNKVDESKVVKKRWRGVPGEGYYYINSRGSIKLCHDFRDEEDDYRYITGNYFETKREAELYKQKQLIKQELEDLAMELNEETINLNNTKQYKYYINYVYEDNDFFQSEAVYTFRFDSIYCTNKNFLEVARERIGEEKLKILFGVNNE